VNASPAAKVIRETNFPGIAPLARGKVRDIYDLGDRAAHRRHRPPFGVRRRHADTRFPTKAASSRSSLSSGLIF